MKHRPPNLLVLGASGNVARALLRRLGGQRARFGRVGRPGFRRCPTERVFWAGVMSYWSLPLPQPARS